MSAPQIPVKYCKALLATGSVTLNPGFASRFLDKIFYEFWGFCVNGGTSLTEPGGFAAISYPSGFESGSLLAAGHDGVTSFGTDVFSSPGVNFFALNSGSLIGTYLVTWDPGGDSTEDSVYLIKSIEDATHIRVDIHSGGKRRLGNHPWFWDRNNINWRIVDFAHITKLQGWKDGHYMVFNLVGAPKVNSGQAVPQVQWLHRTGTNGGDGVLGLVFSPSGTWDPTSSSFSDATPENKRTWFGLNLDLSSSVSSSIYASQALYTFIGGGDFLIGHARGYPGSDEGLNIQTSFTAGSGFHIEVPKRLYTPVVDPNPLAWITWENFSPSQIAQTYYDGFRMVGLDGQVRQWTTLVRSPMGTGIRPTYSGKAYGQGQWQQFNASDAKFSLYAFDIIDKQYTSTDGVLSLTSVPGQYSLARVRLRRVRFTSAELQGGMRLGDPITDPPGLVHLANGVLWPWDGSILPEGPWRFGV